ncbi:MAG: hypothetical protein ACI9UA_004880 [Pseudoalteromonas tetraodonis]|jgi:hypothetical protein
MKPKHLLTAACAIALGASIQSAAAREIALSDEWSFFDPEGNASIANQSTSGFDVTFADIRKSIENPDNPGNFLEGNAVRSRVYQIFENLEMNKIGDAVEISFDLELLTPILENNRGDLHFSLFDTSTNYEFIPLLHIGPNPDREAVGDFIKFRIDGFITPNSATFDPADITGMAVGGNSRAGQAHHPGKPLAETGFVHNFRMRVERVSDTEHSFSISWTYRASGSLDENPILGTSTYSFASYDETTGAIDGQADAATSDVWANSKLSQFNGFGLMLHDDDPFDQDNNDATFDSGTMRISNLLVDYTTVEHPPFSITAVTRGMGGNTVQWESVAGATYSLWTSTDLKMWNEVNDTIIASGEVSEFDDTTSPAAGRRYYQVRWNPGNQ